VCCCVVWVVWAVLRCWAAAASASASPQCVISHTVDKCAGLAGCT
jgi:hypothetical protein